MSDWLKRYSLIDTGLASGFPYLGYREICEVSDARPAVIDEMGEWEKIFGKDIVKPYYRLLSVLNGPFVRTTHSVPAVFRTQDPKNWEPDFLWAKTQVATLADMNSRDNEDCFKLDVAEGMAADLYAALEHAASQRTSSIQGVVIAVAACVYDYNHEAEDRTWHKVRGYGVDLKIAGYANSIKQAAARWSAAVRFVTQAIEALPPLES